MGGGPPPKKDNSAQRNEWVQTQNANRRAEADAYNQRVSAFNDSIASYLGNASRARGEVRGLNITNDELFGNYSNLADQRSRLSMMNWNETAPTFSATVSSPFADDYSSGMVDLERPTLMSANMQGYNSALADFDESINAINKLRSERTAEENRVRSFIASQNSAIQGLQGQLSNANLGDYRNLRSQFDSQLANLRGQYDGFSSLLLGDGFMTSEFAGLGARFNDLNNAATEFTNRYNTEVTRNRDFENQLSTNATDWLNRLSQATIADNSLLSDAEAQLNLLRSQAGNYRTDIGIDLSQELGLVDSAASRLNSLRSQRTAEENRLQQMRNSALSEALGINEAASMADGNNLNAINAIQSRLSGLRTRIGADQTALGRSYIDNILNELNTQLSPVEQTLTSLRTDRQGRLDQLLGQANGQVNGLADIALSNESAFTDRRNRLNTYMGQLSQFVGNDLADERAAIQANIDQVDGRLQELSNRRSQIEQQARELQAAIQNGSFYNLADLDPRQQQLAALQAEQKLYNAAQALDEIDAISQQLTSQRQRIERDAMARTTAADAERNTLANFYSGGTPTSMNLLLGNMTPEQIAALLAANQNRNTGTPGVQTASTFSSNLALA